MKKIKDKEIYPRFEFRLSHEEKAWLTRELKSLKEKFDEMDYAIPKNVILVSALRHGIRYLKNQKRIKGIG